MTGPKSGSVSTLRMLYFFSSTLEGYAAMSILELKVIFKNDAYK